MPGSDALFEKVHSYLKPEEIAQLERALTVGRGAHDGQFRKSGEPYISHPIAVAGILADWRLDVQALMAGVLHDVVEDTTISKTELAARFGKTVAELVDGVSKLERLHFQTKEEAQAESFRKMVLAMSKDVRVILIKLADRLHNMRTMGSMAPFKQKRIAHETLDIYAAIANRIGLNAVYQELQDLSFRYLYPNRFSVLEKAIKAARGNRRELVNKILHTIDQRLLAMHLDAKVSGREKHLYSIYSKMQEKHLSFSEVLDVYGFRVIVPDIMHCYMVLGALHQLYKPIPGKFKDYIAMPKPNGYQSLHTHLFGPYGTPIEVQIRTTEMHKVAETGVASHWLYKSGETSHSEIQQKTHQWLQNLLEVQSNSHDSMEFLEHVKVELFPDDVYVFSPKGKIYSLPKGATVVDFAYAVHSDIGNHCVAAKVNAELTPLRTVLKSGEQVEIITAAHAKPNPAWLNFVVTGKARSHIRHFLKTVKYEESIQLGEGMLKQALFNLNTELSAIREEQWAQFLHDVGAKNREEILADIGVGKRLAMVVARRLLLRGDVDDAKSLGPVTIRGTEGLAVQFAKCCRPIPGDPIIGVIRQGQGLVIHTHDCQQLRKRRLATDEWFDAQWASDIKKTFDVGIKVTAKNERGVLGKLASAIASAHSNIIDVSSEDMGDRGPYCTISFAITVENRLHLAQVMKQLRQLPEVVRIGRVRG